MQSISPHPKLNPIAMSMMAIENLIQYSLFYADTLVKLLNTAINIMNTTSTMSLSTSSASCLSPHCSITDQNEEFVASRIQAAVMIGLPAV